MFKTINTLLLSSFCSVTQTNNVITIHWSSAIHSTVILSLLSVLASISYQCYIHCARHTIYVYTTAMQELSSILK